MQQYFSLEKRNKSQVLYNFFLFFFWQRNNPVQSRQPPKTEFSPQIKHNATLCLSQYNFCCTCKHTHTGAASQTQTHTDSERPFLQLCSAYAKIRIHTHTHARTQSHMYIRSQTGLHTYGQSANSPAPASAQIIDKATTNRQQTTNPAYAS